MKHDNKKKQSIIAKDHGNDFMQSDIMINQLGQG